MGYPMTYQRVINRNRLATGDYDSVGDANISLSVPGKRVGPFDSQEAAEGAFDVMCDVVREGAEKNNQAVRALLGDLRRMEADAADEGAIAQHIAARTGVDVEVVAAVLKEFVSY